MLLHINNLCFIDHISGAVGPRHPLRKDPDLDYDVDSDEEWEEVCLHKILNFHGIMIAAVFMIWMPCCIGGSWRKPI